MYYYIVFSPIWVSSHGLLLFSEKKNASGLDLGSKEGRGKLAGVEEAKTVVRMVCMRE